MPRAHSRPIYKPFACACGETQPHEFHHPYKSICARCRSAREAKRLREKNAQRKLLLERLGARA